MSRATSTTTSSGRAIAEPPVELAALFYRSGWTQEELAKIEGKSQQWVSYRVTFGSFLTFATTVANPEFAPMQAGAVADARRSRG